MSGPYRVERNKLGWCVIIGPTPWHGEICDWEVADAQCDQLNAAYAAGLEARKPSYDGARCMDCGLAYRDPGFCDFVVDDAIWERIVPGRNGGGLLCAVCICRRCVDAGIENVAGEFTSGPFAAGLAARGGREAEIRGMERAKAAVLNRTYARSDYERRADSRECADLIQSEIDKARALTPTEDREYREAVEKLMEEGSG